jgi:hypothetical protein
MKRWTGLVDTPSGYLSAAYDLELDELSIKTRVVNSMLSLDANRGRDLFAQIPKLKLAALSCRDALGYDLSGFYQTLKEVQQKSFTPKEISDGNALRFIQPYISDIVSPAQVAPIVGVIADSELPASELNLLISSLVSALKGVQDDPRSFHSRIEWLLHANNLLKKTRMLGAQRSKIIDVFNTSTTQPLQLYSQFDDLVSAAFHDVVPNNTEPDFDTARVVIQFGCVHAKAQRQQRNCQTLCDLLASLRLCVKHESGPTPAGG